MSSKNLLSLALAGLFLASPLYAADGDTEIATGTDVAVAATTDSADLTLRKIEQLQQQKALVEAQTALEKAKAEADQAHGVASPTGMMAMPSAPRIDLNAVRMQEVLSTVSIAGIYRKPSGAMSADLFVNTARVPVVEGSELPSGLRVTRITPSSVDVRTPKGQSISLNFPGLPTLSNGGMATPPMPAMPPL